MQMKQLTKFFKAGMFKIWTGKIAWCWWPWDRAWRKIEPETFSAGDLYHCSIEAQFFHPFFYLLHWRVPSYTGTAFLLLLLHGEIMAGRKIHFSDILLLNSLSAGIVLGLDGIKPGTLTGSISTEVGRARAWDCTSGGWNTDHTVHPKVYEKNWSTYFGI